MARRKSFPVARPIAWWCCARARVRDRQTRRQGDRETGRQGDRKMSDPNSATPQGAEHSGPAETAKALPRRRSRRWLILLVSLSPCLLVLPALWWLWQREPAPEPPALD